MPDHPVVPDVVYVCVTGGIAAAAITDVGTIQRVQRQRSVFTRGFDGKRVGPFASRTSDRLTPIGVTEVELLEVNGTTLVVRNLDAFNGTPVLDIKVSMASLKRNREQREQNGTSD